MLPYPYSPACPNASNGDPVLNEKKRGPVGPPPPKKKNFRQPMLETFCYGSLKNQEIRFNKVNTTLVQPVLK